MDTKQMKCDQLSYKKCRKELLEPRENRLTSLHFQVQLKASQAGGTKRFWTQNPKKRLNTLKKRKFRRKVSQPRLKKLQL